MSKKSYQKKLERVYTNLKPELISSAASETLDKILCMEHPQREQTLVAWILKTNLCNSEETSSVEQEARV